MYPILFKIGKLTIYTYGLFIAMGFLSGLFLAKKEASRVGEDPEKMMDLMFYLLIACVVFSRLLYVATNPRMFIEDPLEIFRLWNGGLVFYGAFIGGLLTLIVYTHLKGMSVWKTTDILAPSIALGHFFGRIGCFFAGCCHGLTCDLPWAITFSHPNSLAPIGVPLHPTQIYSALNNLIIFGFLWTYRRRTSFEGQLFWIYVMIYGITRSIIELFRGDFRGTIVMGIFSISQIIGLTLSVVAIFMLIFLSKRRNQNKPRNERNKR